MIMIFGEITTSATVNYEAVIREALKEIGYDDPAKGLDYKTVNVIVAIEEQSPDIAQSVDATKLEEIGAGDQGIMFGYATDETESLMPLTHQLATSLGARLTEVRKTKVLDWVRPDGKTQVTVEYKMIDGRPIPQRVHTVVISTQHSEEVSQEQIREGLMEQVVRIVVPAKFLDDETIYYMNPSGRFVIGGPHGDAGLTGRKIIIDSYGGWGAHGGGAFSGKDSTKVDRSAAYAARWVAKSLVHNGLCHRVLVQLSYAIGIASPLSIHVDSYGTAPKLSGERSLPFHGVPPTRPLRRFGDGVSGAADCHLMPRLLRPTLAQLCQGKATQSWSRSSRRTSTSAPGALSPICSSESPFSSSPLRTDISDATTPTSLGKNRWSSRCECDERGPARHVALRVGALPKRDAPRGRCSELRSSCGRGR